MALDSSAGWDLYRGGSILQGEGLSRMQPRALDAWDHVIVGRPGLPCNTRLLQNMFEAIGDQANVKHFVGIVASQRPGYVPVRLMVEKMPDRGDET